LHEHRRALQFGQIKPEECRATQEMPAHFAVSLPLEYALRHYYFFP
jgi:hypothetical protein